METLTINPEYSLMDFECRPMNFKYLMGEFAWYLIRDNNIDFINNFSSFWKNIADDNGNINSNYGKILFGEQLQWALDALKNDKNTRQSIAFINQPKFQYEGNKDFVCTMYLNFWIRDNKLNMKVQMRSNDIFYGLSYDAPFFSFIQQSMYMWLQDTYDNLELGTYYHSADNIHFYEKHFENANDIASKELKQPLSFKLKTPLFYLKDGNMLASAAGSDFITDVINLLNNPKQLTQESSREVMNKYIVIQ